MNRKNIILGGVAVAMATVVGASAVSAHFEDNVKNQAKAEFSPEKRAEIAQIFETKDYDAFKTHIEEMGNQTC